MADVDIESEKYRWMGSARLDFYVSLNSSLAMFFCALVYIWRVAYNLFRCRDAREWQDINTNCFLFLGHSTNCAIEAI